MINTWILIIVMAGTSYESGNSQQHIEFPNKNLCSAARNTMISEHKRYGGKHPRHRFLVISCVKG